MKQLHQSIFINKQLVHLSTPQNYQMNLQQVIFFIFSSVTLSQYNNQQQQQQYYNQQPYSSAQSIVNSYYDNYYPSGQYRQSFYSANSAPINNISSYRQERMAERQNVIQSVAAANGYNDPSAIPENVRQSIIASYMAANSDKISQRIQSASAFMATQTQINPTSLSQAISSIAATATGKKKGIFERLKKKKATGADTISATATTGLNQGFKNFFKSIQMKIQKTSTTSSIAPTSTA